jgi:hypothetical protein
MNAVCGPSTAQEVTLWVSDWNQVGAPPIDVRLAGGTTVTHQVQWQPLPQVPGTAQTAGRLTVSGLVPETKYGVIVDPGGVRIDLWPRTLPVVLPPQGMTFLLGSCYYRPHDDGEIVAALQDLRDPEPPWFKLLVGDQIYSDVPLRGFVAFHGLGAAEYAERYAQHWSYEPYRKFLATGACFFTCDDHEWWNNAPEWQPQLPWTWTLPARQASFQNGLDTYHFYQRPSNAAGGLWYTIDIPPVSIFVADTRSQRTPYDAVPRRLMSPAELQAIVQWTQGLRGPAFLVLGQPLFGTLGDWRDYNLPDFADEYRILWDVIEQAPHRITILTGDIHVGRLARSPGVNGVPNRPPVYEVTASPLALVPGGGQAGLDQEFLVTTQGGLNRGYSRDVELLFGTRGPNFAIVRLVPLPGPTPRVRADFVLWDIGKGQVARDVATGRPCWFRDLILE